MSGQASQGPAPAARLAPPGQPAPPRRRREARRIRVLGTLTGVLVAVVVALVLWLPQRSSGNPDPAGEVVAAAWQRPVVGADGLAERSGVRITQVAVTGGGGLVDLRYQVVDPDKANALHAKRTPPALIDETTGVVVNQLLMNHAHKGQFKAGVTYYLVFSNPGNWVRRGGMVTVLLGDAEVQHVVVR